MKTKEFGNNSVGSPGSSYAREHYAKLYNAISRICRIRYIKNATAYMQIWWQLGHFQKVQDAPDEGKRARIGNHKNAQSIPLISSYQTKLFGNISLIFQKYLSELSQLLGNSNEFSGVFKQFAKFSYEDQGDWQEFRAISLKLICKGALCKII